jgi:hypothetical protein
MAFTASTWGQGRLLTGLSPGSSITGFHAVITKDNLPTSALDTGLLSLINGGGDFRLSTDINGATQLPVEIVTCVTNATASSTKFIAWIRFPTYASGTRSVYAFWNKAGQSQPAASAAFGSEEVWQDFEVVIHQGSIVDSTGNHTPSLVGSPSLATMMWGGQGYDFQSSGQYITIPHASSLNIEKDYSVDIWSNAGSGSDQFYLDKTNSNVDGFRFFKSDFTGASQRSRHPDLSAANLDSAAAFGLYREASTFDGTTRSNLRSGVILNSDTPTGTVTTTTTNLIIANDEDFIRPLDGVLGEFWLAIPNRTTDRVTEESNQSNPASFWTAGTVFVPGGTALTVTESSSTLNIESLDPSIDFTGLISIVEGSKQLNINSIDPTVTLTATLTITESTSTFNITNNDPVITLTPPDTLVITESTATLNITTQSPDITLSGTILIIESTKTINMLTQTPQVGFGTTWTDRISVSTVWTDGVINSTIWTTR